MKKRYKKLSTVFIATLLFALVLLGSTAILLLNNLMQNPPADEPSSLEIDSVKKEYSPTAEEAQTALFILDAGKNPHEKLFMLTRFLPEEKTLWLTPIQGDAYAQINTKKSTIYEFYRTGGALSAVSAAENAFNIPIERYAKLDKEGFKELAEMFGGVIFNVPRDMTYRNPDTGELTDLKAGIQTLDGNMIRQMLTFPELTEDERIKLSSSAVSSMINGGINSRLYDNAEYFFNSFVNSAETNITAYDFSLRGEAMVYVMKNAEEPAVLKIPSGEYDEKNRFVIDREFRKSLAEKFRVEPIIK